jgi:hypothetical protein
VKTKNTVDKHECGYGLFWLLKIRVKETSNAMYEM